MVEVRGTINAPAGAVWQRLGDFGAVAEWNPFVEQVEIAGSGVGMTRVITADGGSRIVEVLMERDDAKRHLRYSVELESGQRSIADVTVVDLDSQSVIVWKSIRDHEPSAEAAELISKTLLSRIGALAAALA